MSTVRSELLEVAMADERYAVEAYEFVCHALRYTQDHVSPQPAIDGDEAEAEEIHHVTGQQLCEGIRRFALDRFGMMAATVFRCWGVQSTADFGRIVYNLIDAELWHRSPTDSIDDFADQFDFAEAFVEGYRITWDES